ncbi:hypothetical protein C1752_08439 [Acaryochloris thomasi RCC1774]|uniref:Uncharacterized protein n=1 Tax=Acaryochloris thomasi RCC1774 TaxID=1764569 RepID=A0A2W1JQ14_9CYAN|nr:hypothetical protein C1752_08439 [Acaryochloris thomasi RCC1774]
MERIVNGRNTIQENQGCGVFRCLVKTSFKRGLYAYFEVSLSPSEVIL